MKTAKFKIKALVEKEFVKFYITSVAFKGRVKKHVGKGTLAEFNSYLIDFSMDIEKYFDGKTVSIDAVQIFTNNYIKRNKNAGSIFNYSEEFIELKRKTFNKKTKRYLSDSSINCYILSISTFKQFLFSTHLGEQPEVLNVSVLNDYYNFFSNLSHNYRVKLHFRVKEFITFLRIVKRLNIDDSYLQSVFTEEYDNQKATEKDRSLSIQDLNKLTLLRNEFNVGNFRLKAYKKAKTIPEVLQAKQRAIKEANLKRTLDCFLFMCSTGMYIADITKRTITIENNGKGSFVCYRRSKNNSYCNNIPLYDKGCLLGHTILKEYAIKSESNFPLNLSLNQFDKNLRIISELAGLNFRLTSKMGRKTFASIYYFNYGIKINYIQMFLGHKDQKHTMHYLRIDNKDHQNQLLEQLGLN